MSISDRLNNMVRKKLQETLRYPVVAVSDDYDSETDFFYTFKKNLELARNNVDRRLGYVLTAVDVSASQLGLTSRDSDDEQDHASRRFFFPMTEQQADIIISIQAEINLEAFMMMFSRFATRDIVVRPDNNTNIAVIQTDGRGSILGVLLVPLVKLPLDPDLVEDAIDILGEEEQSEREIKRLVQRELERLERMLRAEQDWAAISISEEDIEDEIDLDGDSLFEFTTGENELHEDREEQREKNDSPYSATALHEMYDKIGDNEVDDESIDFIFAMMNKMSAEQKDKISETLSKHWSDVMGPRVGSLLMSLNSIAEDIPVSSKNYLDRVNTIFGDSISEEAKTHMVVQFHSALVQKII